MASSEAKILKPGSPDYSVLQVSVCDKSMKRDADHLQKDASKKSSKRRRSSLSSHRRSITGNIISAFPIDPESQAGSETGSQKSNLSDDCASSQSSSSDGHKLLPNPVNIQMDGIIEKVKSQIAKYHDECKQWNDLLEEFEKQNEASSQLPTNLTLPVADIPTDVKELAMSEYVTCKPPDLAKVKSQLDRLVQEYKFNKEACMEDLELIKETVETVKKSNKILNTCLSQDIEKGIKSDLMEPDTRSQPTDSRKIMLDYLSYA